MIFLKQNFIESLRSGQKNRSRRKYYLLIVNSGAVVASKNIIVLGALERFSTCRSKGNKQAIVSAENRIQYKLGIANIVKQLNDKQPIHKQCVQIIQNDDITIETLT